MSLTELVFILDRSGSMGGLESDTIGGFNGMIDRQKKEEKEEKEVFQDWDKTASETVEVSKEAEDAEEAPTEAEEETPADAESEAEAEEETEAEETKTEE